MSYYPPYRSSSNNISKISKIRIKSKIRLKQLCN